ncbi:MAG: hypothetical protein IMZ52_02335 [Actinobacteria bacterium]|nr:hypothetical protein [Actinomycetota bacterium]MBE3114861.1 hypothetical protein [Actinomycetota bacterium]
MKEVHPSEIKIGDYYIQEWESDGEKLLKICEKNDGREMEIGGTKLKIVKDITHRFHVGSYGSVYYRNCKFYLLSEGEAMLYMI